jgi:transcriptional regulator with XRE-family HTH domain
VQTWADRLKLAAKEKGLSQAELAAAVDKSPPAINQYMSGERRPPPETIVKLCVAVGVSADWLLGVPPQPSVPGDLAAQAVRKLGEALALLGSDPAVIDDTEQRLRRLASSAESVHEPAATYTSSAGRTSRKQRARAGKL